jgi:eukaryotic-like serine/threonine-protein kinase
VSELQPGDLIAERFRIESLLGEGGIARVYKVRHTRLGSTHALKILHLLKPALADRLLLEGRIQAQLHHPNLVRVTDVVEHQGMPCLVMEYVAGTQLQALLVEQGALPLDVALPMFAGILSAVATAHDLGVLHRDLKPANILLTRQGDRWLPKVSDFGIAKIASGGLREGETQAGVTMGTPGYMAPEQIEDSSQIDHRADIFALGALLYEMLSGSRPFAQDTTYKTLRATIEGQLSPLRELQPGVPAHLAAAVHRCLAVEMEDRFPDCHALADALFADQPALRALVSKLESEAIPEGLQRPESTRLSPDASPTRSPPAGPPTPTVEQPSAPTPLMPLGSGATLVADPTDLPSFDPANFSPASQAGETPRLSIGVAGPGARTHSDSPSQGEEDDDEQDAPPPRRRELPLTALAGLALAAGLGALGLWWAAQPDPLSQPAAALTSEAPAAPPTPPAGGTPPAPQPPEAVPEAAPAAIPTEPVASASPATAPREPVAALLPSPPAEQPAAKEPPPEEPPAEEPAAEEPPAEEPPPRSPPPRSPPPRSPPPKSPSPRSSPPPRSPSPRSSPPPRSRPPRPASSAPGPARPTTCR